MKKIITLCLSLCMTAALAAPAYALEYSIAAPDDYDFGKPESLLHRKDHEKSGVDNGGYLRG